ncbi:hypothetical protein NUW58_g6745 [Xylaria curta]|uniref:Uncharacterized protein n=1 Tax=Xylaria curta TaxID=42375 RepID=A0ACC1NRU9_9PEZI|nr:hypothetical protein NUW58_g6745 [Xylaria curta]
MIGHIRTSSTGYSTSTASLRTGRHWFASKHNRFNDRQPMFGWSPESTGRAHGFVENENPGQLQDLLEFFDGSKEGAKKIILLAETCVHVVLRPKSPPSSPATGTESII